MCATSRLTFVNLLLSALCCMEISQMTLLTSILSLPPISLLGVLIFASDASSVGQSTHTLTWLFDMLTNWHETRINNSLTEFMNTTFTPINDI